MSSCRRRVEEVERRQREAEERLEQAQQAREQAELLRQGLLVAGAQLEATGRSLTERLEALRARLSEVERDRADLAQQVEAKSAQRQDAVIRSGELLQQAQGHETQRDQLQKIRQRLEGELQGAEETLRGEGRRRDQVLPQVLAAEQQLSALAQQIQEQGRQRSERDFRRARLTERLQELYRIDDAALTAALQAEAAALSSEQRAQMSERVQKLRARLEGMGPVSLGSVDEYDALTQRLEFLKTQQEDLIEARDDLKASIAQINRTARTQFRETFGRIKQEFVRYFTRLFNGGHADLLLLDEEDVLASGIEIVARPPGKRLQSISLLSGGERALTAIALLFALFKVRPSPFCILDEIDAPLDEANVQRFITVLEEFLELSQFILVTHNKKTITKADCLYGVTMEEPGISKILSAKLTSPAPAAAV